MDEELVNRIVNFMTIGKCVHYSKCYSPIEKYEEFIKEENMIFGISYNSQFNVMGFIGHITKYNWHVIADGGYWRSNNYKDIPYVNQLFMMYGVQAMGVTERGISLYKENIC